MAGPEPDYITITPAVFPPGRYLVSVMTYNTSGDEWVMKKVSAAQFNLEGARALARLWAATLHLEIRTTEGV